MFPWVISECVSAIWFEEFSEFFPLRSTEARANSNVLQTTGIVKQAKQL